MTVTEALEAYQAARNACVGWEGSVSAKRHGRQQLLLHERERALAALLDAARAEGVEDMRTRATQRVKEMQSQYGTHTSRWYEFDQLIDRIRLLPVKP